MEVTEESTYKCVYPNPWITARSTCSKRGDNNAATIFQFFEVTGNDSYNCIYSFLTECIEAGEIKPQKKSKKLD